MLLDRDIGDPARLFRLILRIKSSSVAAFAKWTEGSQTSITYTKGLGDNLYTVHIARKKDTRLISRISIPVYLEGSPSIEKLLVAMNTQYESFLPKAKKHSRHSESVSGDCSTGLLPCD